MTTARAVGTLFFLSCVSVGQAAADTPLLDYALSQQFAPAARELDLQRLVKQSRGALERNPPPTENCAQTLGASRFAALYDDLGRALDDAGDFEAAVDAYHRALECTPRATYLRVPLATDLLYLNRYDEARETAMQGLTRDESDLGLNAVLAELDYVDERWDEAIPRLRRVATDAEDEEFATYFQCLSWIAQRRSGIAKPQLVARDEPEGWPNPILAALRGSIDEREVVQRTQEESDANRRRENLTEALYYLGVRRLIDGDLEMARQYMAAAVDLKVYPFIEYHFARVELSRLRERSNSR